MIKYIFSMNFSLIIMIIKSIILLYYHMDKKVIKSKLSMNMGSRWRGEGGGGGGFRKNNTWFSKKTVFFFHLHVLN